MFAIHPGLWTRAFDPRWAKGVKAIAIVTCPSCGLLSTLSSNTHAVDTSGKVTPSYVCPHQPCSFHEWVRLEGWTP